MQKLCEQVWERILGYLEAHHHARLFETGDKSVQKWIILAPREFNPISRLDSVYSSLVCDLLLPYAETVHAKWAVVEKLGTSRPRIKNLTVISAVGEYFDPAVYPHRRRLVHDLTSFERLQTISFSNRVYVDLLLPHTLTSLKMYDCCFGLVQNLASLVNLTHISCSFRDEQLESVTADCWPATLTSLEMYVITLTDDTSSPQPGLSGLPSTLRHLILSDYSGSRNGRVLDVMPPSSCPNLESFEIFGAPCAMKQRGQQFPRTLTRLVIGSSRCTWDSINGSLLEAIAAASSITHLDLRKISTEITPDMVDDYVRMLYTVLPRLDEESLLILIGAVVDASHCSKPLIDACTRSLTKYGYCTHFINFVTHARQSSDFSMIVDAANKCANQALVRRYFAQNADIRSRFGRLFLYYVATDERAMAIKWMADNALRTFVNSSDLAKLERETIGKIVELTVDGDAEQVCQALAKWRFDSLREVDIPQPWPHSLDAVVLAMHSNKDQYPSLCRISVGKRAVSDQSAVLLAEMRLYPSSTTFGDYTFRVAPPSKRRLSEK
jgi:hypothetical protein